MSSKKSLGPMLFINQSKSRTPADNMQEVYTNRHELETQKQAVPQDKPGFSLPDKEMAGESMPEAVAHSPKKQGSVFNRVKSFKELNLYERLEYLINFPKVLPPVPCVFYTSKQRYQGYLIGHEDEEITVQFHDQTTINIPVEDLRDIIMIGIKR